MHTPLRRAVIRTRSSGHHQMGHRSVKTADSRTTERTAINSKEPAGASCRIRLSRIVAHSAAGPFPQESVLTHRRLSDGLCRPRWRRSSVSTKQATASLARVRFVMSERRPSGHRTRHMPGWAESGTTLGLRGLKRRALAAEAGARLRSAQWERITRPPVAYPRGTACECRPPFVRSDRGKFALAADAGDSE